MLATTGQPQAFRKPATRHGTRYLRYIRPTMVNRRRAEPELIYNLTARTYQAPLQLKSTDGVLDRQTEPPQALTNCWTVGRLIFCNIQNGDHPSAPAADCQFPTTAC